MPRYLVYRAQDPIHHTRLPAHVAGMFKVVIGLNDALLHQAQFTILVAPEMAQEPVSVDKLFDHLEAHGLLIGTSQVCAGPDTLIRRAIEAMVVPPGDAPGAASKTRDVVGDVAPFLQFCRASMNATILSWAYLLISESIYRRAREAALASATLPMEGEPSILAPADPQLALLSGVPPTVATGILRRVLDLGVETLPEEEVLRRELSSFAAVLEEDDWPNPSTIDTLTRGRASKEMAESIAAYLRLESVAARVAKRVKGSYLEGLGHERNTALIGASRPFRPPTLRMRNMLGTVYDLRFLAGRVESKGGGSLALDWRVSAP